MAQQEVADWESRVSPHPSVLALEMPGTPSALFGRVSPHTGDFWERCGLKGHRAVKILAFCWKNLPLGLEGLDSTLFPNFLFVCFFKAIFLIRQ